MSQDTRQEQITRELAESLRDLVDFVGFNITDDDCSDHNSVTVCGLVFFLDTFEARRIRSEQAKYDRATLALRDFDLEGPRK